METKKPSSSIAVWSGAVGAVVFFLRIWKGWSLDTDETVGFVEHLATLKASIAGLMASVGVIVFRFKAVNFDKSIFKSRTFWMAIGKGAAVIAAAFGADVDLEGAAASAFDITTEVLVAITTVTTIYGRATANKPLSIEKPTEVLPE